MFDETSRKICWYVVIAVFLVGILAPFVWMASTSLKPESDIMELEARWIPKRFTLNHYRWVFGIQKKGVARAAETVGLGIYFRNTIIVSLGAGMAVAIISTLAGYALARFRFPARKGIALFLLSTTFFPAVLLLIPWYVLLNRLRLLDSLAGLILSFTAVCMPFSVWMMKGFIASIPPAMEECAMTDGCGRVGAFLRVTLPLTASGIVAVMLYTIVMSWNDFLIPLVVASSPKSKTIAIGLTELLTFYGKTNWGGLMAGSVITALPVVIIFVLLQRQLVSGMTAGAVKG